MLTIPMKKKTLKSSRRDFGNKLCCHFPHFKISFPPAPQFTNLKKGRPRTFICDTRSRKTAVFSRFMTLRSSTNLPRKIHHVQNRECTQKGVTQRYTQMFFWGDVIEKNWNGRSVAWKDRPSRRSHDSLIGTMLFSLMSSRNLSNKKSAKTRGTPFVSKYQSWNVQNLGSTWNLVSTKFCAWVGFNPPQGWHSIVFL